jgi:hypothetical protein
VSPRDIATLCRHEDLDRGACKGCGKVFQEPRRPRSTLAQEVEDAQGIARDILDAHRDFAALAVACLRGLSERHVADRVAWELRDALTLWAFEDALEAAEYLRAEQGARAKLAERALERIVEELVRFEAAWRQGEHDKAVLRLRRVVARLLEPRNP